MTDEQLVQGCVENNAIAQRELYDKFTRKMMGVCLRYTDHSEEAQDILQNGFIKVFDSIKSFKADGSLEGWIRRIMVNTALDNYRKTKALKQNTNIESVEYQLHSNDQATDSLAAEDLLKVIQRLPIGFRTVFNMYAIEGYSHKEIADQLGISESTSKSQYSRARAHLQKMVTAEKVY